MQNPQCVWCSQIFIKDYIIQNKNPQFKKVVGLTFTDLLDLSNTEKFFNAVTNSGGGVIIVGTKKVTNAYVVEGINFKTIEEALEKEQIVKQILKKIKPPCQYKVERVLVHCNFM